VPVVIDEFPYLVRANASLPSTIQNAFGPLRAERERSQTRLLLCGSALSFMGGLAGNAPLRGRAGLELVVPTLDYLRAAEFWNISDPVLALKVHAITGGTPAYRREFARDDTPAGPGDFDDWVKRTVLNPASPLFREARYLLSDEPDLRDIGLYHSVLAAIAEGNNTRGGIASYLGRKTGDLSHPLNVLQDCGLVVREPDAFKDNRSTFRIAEPLITFYHAVMRPIWSDLEHTRDASLLWQRSQRRFTSNVLGPHFEQVCRYWTRHFAAEETVGGIPVRVETGTVHDVRERANHQLDVVVFGLADSGPEPVIAIGEAKWNEVMSMTHLDRLRHIRDLLTAQVSRVRPGAAGSAEVFARLVETVPWRAEQRKMYDRVVAVPRLLCFYGEDAPLPDPVLTGGREALNAHYGPELGEPFRTAGLCLYRDGRDSVAWHGDTIGRGQTEDTMVAIVSLGSPRVLALRPRGGSAGSGTRPLRFEIGHGDLLVMGGSCQRTWEHAVPKTSKAIGPRISVQFRPRGVR